MLRLFRQYYPIRNLFFILGEGAVIFSAILVAYDMFKVCHLCDPDNAIFLKALLITLIFQVFLYYNDLYDLQVTDTFIELAIRLFQSLGAAAIFFGLIALIFPQILVGEWIFLLGLILVLLLIVSWRFGYASILNLGIFNQKIALLGSGELAGKILKEIRRKKDCGYAVSMLVQDCQPNADFEQYKSGCDICKKDYDGLCETAAELKVKKVVVALGERRGTFPAAELLKCRMEGIQVLDGNSFYEMLSGKLMVRHTNPGWLIYSEGFNRSWMQHFLKRLADLLIASLMLVLCLPLMLLVALLIKIDDPSGPVIFSQDRVGQRKKPYRVHKFRSMVNRAEEKTGPVWAAADDMRVTRVGKVIRKLRIDEIPQLWNVLKGEMSFVGPRPEREFFVKQLEKVIPYYAKRFTVKPGVTGWAQVSYGYGASVEDAIEKLNYDLFYIKNMSIFMDLMIVLKTIKIVVFQRGAR